MKYSKYLAVLFFIISILPSCKDEDICWECREKVTTTVLIGEDTIYNEIVNNFIESCDEYPEFKIDTLRDDEYLIFKRYFYVCGR